MRSWLIVAMSSFVALAGCADVGTGQVDGVFPLEVYVFDEPGVDVFAGLHGLMVRITNPGVGSMTYQVTAPNMTIGRFGPVSYDGWDATEVDIDVGNVTSWADVDQLSVEDTLAAGASRLWLFEYEYTFVMHVFDVQIDAAGGTFRYEDFRPTATGGPEVTPGMHVTTYTVGVWVNGTSFYTNIAGFDSDPAFPRGYPATDFGGDMLPVYVYDESGTEQPDRSKDTCHFTTITGYNELLKTQREGGTGVRFLAPEEAYTRPGREDFFLYGEPLVFMNRVVAIEDRDMRTDDVPDPQGACFDANRYTPDPIPDVPPSLL